MSKWLRLGAVIALAAGLAEAQEDIPVETVIPLLPVGGEFPVKFQAPSDENVDQVCCLRTDVNPWIELGCVDVTPSEIKVMDVTVTETPLNDAELRCYAIDDEELKSTLSAEAFELDFTTGRFTGVIARLEER
jgi:hypothetical protein